MKRLRLGAVLHFLIAIGHVGCLFALDEAFEAYGIREIMHQMVVHFIPNRSLYVTLSPHFHHFSAHVHPQTTGFLPQWSFAVLPLE